MIMHNAPMKKILLLVLVLASVGLAGCQTMKAHNPFRHREPAYTTAHQERPLEVPPGMSQPATSEALAIPNVGTGAAAATGSTEVPPTAAMSADGAGAPATSSGPLTLSDTPDSVYHRVGLALARGEVGQVTAHDDAAHTYQVAVNTTVTTKSKGGFFHRLFHHSKSEVVAGAVTVSVAPSGAGSVVEASGDPQAAAKVMSVLSQRLQ
jgi:uncharacterized lipoprotein